MRVKIVKREDSGAYLVPSAISRQEILFGNWASLPFPSMLSGNDGENRLRFRSEDHRILHLRVVWLGYPR
jgi:hypothetical protein